MHLVWFDTKEELEQMEEILGVKFTRIKQKVAGMTAVDMDHHLAMVVLGMLRVQRAPRKET